MVKLIFEVVDINDNHPIFPNTVLSETISEGAGRGELFSVKPATDKDTLKFGVVRYFLRDTFGGLFDVSFKERANHREVMMTFLLIIFFIIILHLYFATY